jgi:hypothetical protein
MKDLRARRDTQQGHARRGEPLAVPAQERGLVVALEREVDEPPRNRDFLIGEAGAGHHQAATFRV